jgi:hypothetical protein
LINQDRELGAAGDASRGFPLLRAPPLKDNSDKQLGAKVTLVTPKKIFAARATARGRPTRTAGSFGDGRRQHA